MALLALPVPLLAQAGTDSLPAEPYRLDAVVVVADRYARTLRTTVTATSVLTRADIDALPVRTLAGALEAVPGLIFVEQAGSGRQPIAIARGFFGGGETSYVLLTVDGVPVNDGRTGLVEWSRIPLEDVERIEVLRGSASASYGDAALGAVINVVTRGPGPTGGFSTRAQASVASWAGLGVHASAESRLGGAGLRAALDYERDDGFRDHSRWERFRTSLRLGRTAASGGSGLSGRVAFSRLLGQDPGPLIDDGGFDRRASHPAFEGDDRARSTVEADAEARRVWDGGRRLDAAVRLRWYEQERTRTLLLTPTFGDTQTQDDREVGVWARTQLAEPVGPGLLRVGGEVEGAWYRTRYTEPGTGAPLTAGDAHQWKLGLHGELSGSPVDRLRLVGGLRFDAVLPTNEVTGAPASPSFQQWSPRLGANLAYREGPASAGNLYVSWTRAFKAPTLDQLYDARAIPTGEPGVTITISNGDLRPQRSTAVEAGIYQRLPLGGTERFVEVSLAGYRQWLEDEIDFDVATYSYGNILESRHTGAELSVRAVLSRRLELSHAATVGRATFQTEANRGNQLKNIPEHAFTTTARVAVAEPASVTLTHRATGRVWLDDANTESLAGRSLLDAALRWAVGGVEASLAVRNVFDTGYGSFGFMLYDPFADENVRMVHPGMGRAIEVRLAVGS